MVAIASVVGSHWHPGSDDALILLRAHDVGGRHTPLVGAWSRWGWAHPGPWLFWYLAPFVRVVGDHGALVGAAALNGASALGFVAVGRRRGGAPGAVVAGAFVLVLCRGLGLDFLVDVWNPWIAFLPFVLFLGLTWSACCGDVYALPLAVGVGSFAVQAHASYALLVVGLLVVAAGFVARAWSERARRAVLVSGAVAAVAWAPALVQQVTGHPGNLTRIFDYARDPSEPSAGWRVAARIWGSALHPVGPWITNHDSSSLGLVRSSSPVWAFAVIAVIVTAGVWAHRRRVAGAGELALIVVVANGLALAATARTTGVLGPYLFRWWRGIAMLSVFSIVWSIVMRPRTQRAYVPVAFGGVVIAIAGVMMLATAPAAVPGASVSRAVGDLGPAAAARLDRHERYLVRGHDPRTLDATPTGLYLDLYQRRYDVFSERAPNAALMFGGWRLAGPREVDGIIDVVAVAPGDELDPPRPGARVIATSSRGDDRYVVFLSSSR